MIGLAVADFWPCRPAARVYLALFVMEKHVFGSTAEFLVPVESDIRVPGEDSETTGAQVALDKCSPDAA